MKIYATKEMRLLVIEKSTASYKVLPTRDGNRYQFFCGLSDALVCTSPPFKESSPGEKMLMAWNTYAKAHFNRCHKCGRWVINEMYNPDVLNCVVCTPIEDYPEFCPRCGIKTADPSYFCHMCGYKLLYGGETENENAVAK